VHLFTATDVEILEKILAGSKYETIAQETDQSLSSLKKHIRKLFQRLQASDRVGFMSKYAKHRIVLDNPNK
jgi:DNA-binding NarL/FixJ family response regulator